MQALFPFPVPLPERPGGLARRLIGAKPGLNFNPGFHFLSFQVFFRVIFSILFSRASNHQIVDKKNKTEFSF